jgi:hypothetical protein
VEDADICDFATAIVEFDADAAASARGPTDTTQLRGAVEALVNEADDSEVARLAAAAAAESPDDLDERFWGPGPDSVTAVKAVFARVGISEVRTRIGIEIHDLSRVSAIARAEERSCPGCGGVRVWSRRAGPRRAE